VASVIGAGPARAADIDALLRAMTVEQKVSVLVGASDPESLGQAGYVTGVPSLGIPPLRLTDGPAGVRVRATATAMPAPVALAATFDPGRARRFGEVIGREGRALRQDVLLSPMVNIVRVPQAGRNFETLGEDPLLASRLAEAEFSGIQGAGLIATIKHFVLNNQEHERRTVNVNVDDQALHEIYLPAFEGAIRGGAGAVMCSYNRVRGKWACDSAEVMTDLLRKQLRFEGWVMTDWGATHTLGALEAGLDQEMPGIRGRDQVFASELLGAVKSGAVPMSAVDRAVRRILKQMDRVGLLGETKPPRPSLDVEANAAVAMDVALAGAVLLKNEGGALPLGAESLRSLVLIGPTARTLLVGGGGSSRVIGFKDRERSPLQALVEKAGPSARITHASGLDLEGVAVPASALSLTKSYRDLGQIDFTGSNTLPPTAEQDAYVWTGTLSVPADGEYDLMLQHSGGSGSLSLDGKEVLVARGFFGGSLIPTADGLRNSSTRLRLAAGSHALELKVGAGGFGPGPYPPTGPIQLRLAWATPERRRARLNEAVAAARGASAMVVFAYNEGTEGRDRTSLALPGDQDALIEAGGRRLPGADGRGAQHGRSGADAVAGEGGRRAADVVSRAGGRMGHRCASAG
jgi:beta-glucosidase